MPETVEGRAPVSNRARTPPRGRRRRVRAAALLACAAILLTGCADPGPTEEEIALAAEEARAAQAAEEARAARAAVEELVSATETRLNQTLGIAEAEIIIGNPSATADHPVRVTVSFAPDVAGSVLVDAAADLWTTLTTDGLTVISLMLELNRGQFQEQTARWMMDGIGPDTDGQIQLWARTIAAYPNSHVTLTSDAAPFTFIVRDLAIPKLDAPPGTAQYEILDMCAELGIDIESATISVSGSL